MSHPSKLYVGLPTSGEYDFLGLRPTSHDYPTANETTIDKCHATDDTDRRGFRMNNDPPLSNPLVPVASEDDARATMDALLPRLAERGGSFVAIHVIEKAGGAPDKASVEQRELGADVIFEFVEEGAFRRADDEHGHVRGSLVLDVVNDVDCSVLLAEKKRDRGILERLFGE